jgi:hypothetical protein
MKIENTEKTEIVKPVMKEYPRLEKEIRKLNTRIMQHVVPCEAEKYFQLKIDDLHTKCYDIYPDFPSLFKVINCPQIFDLWIRTGSDLKLSSGENPKLINYSTYLASDKKVEINVQNEVIYLSIYAHNNCRISISAKTHQEKERVKIEADVKKYDFFELLEIDEKLEKYYSENKHLIGDVALSVDKIQEYVDNFMDQENSFIFNKADNKEYLRKVVLERAQKF